MKETRGLITDIQRFSLNDGPGIETTVFFKGCNMACKWCHNPETISARPSLIYYSTKCIGCGQCLRVCKQNALSTDSGVLKVDRVLCVNCGSCTKECYPQALCMCGKEATVGDVMREVLQDRIYYERSGGGVTLSGGEALCQPDFAEALIDACSEEGIAVSLETNLFHSFCDVKRVLKKVSYIYADIKIYDDAAHKEWTGAGNGIILDNAVKLGGLGIPIVFRTPLIPGVSDGMANLTAIAGFIAKIPNVKKYELLNFNPLGAGKYDGLSMANRFQKSRPMPKEEIRELAAKLGGGGITVTAV